MEEFLTWAWGTALGAGIVTIILGAAVHSTRAIAVGTVLVLASLPVLM